MEVGWSTGIRLEHQRSRVGILTTTKLTANMDTLMFHMVALMITKVGLMVTMIAYGDTMMLLVYA